MAESTTTKELLEKGKEAEAAEKLEQAVEIYEQILSDDNLEIEAYDRLMIVYRKLRDYKNELSVVDRGIKAYQEFYDSKTSKSKKVIEISNKLAKSFGLIDKKGNTTYDPEPIGKWKKRRLIIEKRLKPKKK
jgi:tetratricopeptide (TPR) repeat protein